MVLEKTVASPLDCKEIQPVHSEGDQPWDFFGRNGAKAEALDTSCKELTHWKRLIGKDFGGAKITADGDCSHEIKRRLLLARKVMTNLESIFKSRDITLPTKVRLVKAVVFPVVMYGCESWTVKKAEH